MRIVEVDVTLPVVKTVLIGAVGDVVKRSSPTAHPSVAFSMKTEVRGGLAGGLMYADGLRSLHTPKTPESARAKLETARIASPISMIEYFRCFLRKVTTVQEASQPNTSNNIK